MDFCILFIMFEWERCLMRFFKKALCVALIAVLCLTLLPVTVSAQGEAEGSASTDFVLVLDTSSSLNSSDPNQMSLEACKMFIDMIPIENARISVITFGYPDENSGYVFSSRYDVRYDQNRVHVITPLTDAGDLKGKDQIKQNIDENGAKAGDLTPVGMAALAAVDLLESSQAADGNACVILMTDGRLSSSNIECNQQSVNNAIKAAASHNWPIYSIELNYDRKNNSDNSKWGARTVLSRFAEETGAGADGRVEIENAADISAAFLRIFSRFMIGENGAVDVQQADASGVVEQQIQIPSLTSETTIVISGSSVSEVEVVNHTDSVTRKISGNIDEQNLFATVEKGSYICVKLICPTPGTWTIRAHGDPNATIAIYDCSMKDLDLELISDPVLDQKTVMNKGESITFNAYFSYHGVEVLTDDYYGKKQPVIVVTNRGSGKQQEFPMQDTGSGYELVLPMQQLGSGSFTVRARLDDDMFRNGRKFSRTLSLKTENLLPEIVKNPIDPVSCYVNEQLEPIDLSKYLVNPDGDVLEYELVCASDRNVAFDYSVDEQNYLHLSSGFVPGAHQLQLSVRDADMKESLVLDMALEVMDRPVEFQKIDQIEIWSDAYKWQKDGQQSVTLDLYQYVQDPDGVVLLFSAPTAADPNLATTSIQNGQLTINAVDKAKGKTEITYTVDDKVTACTGTIPVKVVSGKAVFWAKNWIYFAIALAVIVVIVIIILYLVANKKVQGKWDITIADQNGHRASIEGLDIRHGTKLGSKSKFALKDLLRGQLVRMTGYESLDDMWLSGMMGVGDFGKIMLCGINGRKGCIVDKIPNNERVTVSYNGQQVKKKTKVTYGELEIVIENDGQKLTITMETR